MDYQVMRLPRYSRGLTLVRFGMFAMLLNFVLSAYVVTKLFGGLGGVDDLKSFMEWTRYALWANLGALGLMLLGALVSLPDFFASKMSPTRILIAVVGFGVAFAGLAWSNSVLSTVIDLLSDPDASLFEIEKAADRLDNNNFAIILRDLAYPAGVIAMVTSIRQTADANEHAPLAEAAREVNGLIIKLAVFDIVYQITGSIGVIGFRFALYFILAGVALLGFWVYVHLRIAKFMKAASILVHEPHNLPMARVVVRTAADTAVVAEEPASDIPVIRQSAPNIRQSGPLRGRRPSGSPIQPAAEIQPTAEPIRPTTAPTFTPPAPPAPAPVASAPSSQPSQPIMVVPAELRPAAAPRAETAPGAPVDEPKLLR